MAGWVYVLHFDRPLAHARHYVGSTQCLRQRLTNHAQGRGSRLTRELFNRGIGWHLASLFQAPIVWMRRIERLAKDQHQAARFCPACHQADPDAEACSVPPAVRWYDTANLPFTATSQALLGHRGTPQVRVRMSRPPDRARLNDFLRALMKHDGDALGFVPVGGERGMTTLIDTGRVAVAWVGREPAGYAAWTKNLSETRIKLHQVGVSDAHRLCGIGRKLIEAVAQVDPSLPMACTVRSDLPANDFWTSVGFEPARERRHRSSGSTLIDYTRSPSNGV